MKTKTVKLKPNAMPKPSTLSARIQMIDIADEFQNNYLTAARYAECNGLTTEHAEQLLTLARAIRTAGHPEH